MSDEGLKLAALYSCKKDITELLVDVNKGKEKIDKLKNALESLPNLVWYKLIAPIFDTEDIFDEQVVRTYWIGHELLKPIINKKGSVILPFHNFVVLNNLNMIGDPDIDSCKISVARANRVQKETLSVFHRSISKKGNLFIMSSSGEKKEVDRGLIDKVGDRKNIITENNWITYHFGIARQALREEEAILFIRKTEEAIKLFNEQQQK